MKNGTRSYEVNQNNEKLFEKLFTELSLDLKSFLKERTFRKHRLQDLFDKPFFHLSSKKKQDRVQAPCGRPHR